MISAWFLRTHNYYWLTRFASKRRARPARSWAFPPFRVRLISFLVSASLGLGMADVTPAQTVPWVALPTPHVETDQITFTTVNFGGHQWIVAGTSDKEL
jgi:hypothetical protein